MPLHVMANFGGSCVSVHGLERYVTLLITFVLFWGCVCDVVHQPHQPSGGRRGGAQGACAPPPPPPPPSPVK